jgi:hypothetical protein
MKEQYIQYFLFYQCVVALSIHTYKEDLFYSIVLVLALGHDLLKIIFSMIKYKTALTFTGMIGAGNNNNKLYKNIHNNKARLKGISLSIHNVERNWYFGLLAATLILSVAISAEFSSASSKAYADEDQIYKTQMLHKPMLITSIGAVEQQGTQQPTNNQTEMQQSPSPQNATIHAFEDAFIGIVNDTRDLSFAYQDEIAKLQSGVYDNQTFVMVTDLYLQMYQQLLARAGTLNQSAASLPQNYSKAIDLYSESIRTEMESQEHLRNYISTGDLAENEKSIQLLSESLKFELEAFKAFRSVANDTTTSNNNTDNISNATAAILGV